MRGCDLVLGAHLEGIRNCHVQLEHAYMRRRNMISRICYCTRRCLNPTQTTASLSEVLLGWTVFNTFGSQYIG